MQLVLRVNLMRVNLKFLEGNFSEVALTAYQKLKGIKSNVMYETFEQTKYLK